VQAAGSEAAVLSLGGGIDYQDLALRKTGNDLLVETGGQDSVRETLNKLPIALS
jgi:hypothetical protein